MASDCRAFGEAREGYMCSSFAASWEEGMYQGCIMRNMRTSCGSRTFPESSNSEGSKRNGLNLRPHLRSLNPTPQPSRYLAPRPPPASPGLKNQEADWNEKLGWQEKTGSKELEEGSMSRGHDQRGTSWGGRSLGSLGSRIQRSFPECWGEGIPLHQIRRPPSAGNSSQAGDGEFLRIPQETDNGPPVRVWGPVPPSKADRLGKGNILSF